MSLTVAESLAVSVLTSWLAQTPRGAGISSTAAQAEEMLALLAEHAYKTMMAGPRAEDGRAAIRAIAARLAAQSAPEELTEQWAALYDDGTWTSGSEQSREEAEEIVATSHSQSPPVLAHRLVGDWQIEEAAAVT
jgi:hypothetical protein